jgi:malonyl CoA-acyl carrier protein transacylase
MSGSAATGGRKSATTEAIAQWAVATATIATTAQWAEAQEWTVKATLIAGIAIGIAAITIATAGAISMTIAAGGASKFASSTRTVTSIAATDNHGKWQKTTIPLKHPQRLSAAH